MQDLRCAVSDKKKKGNPAIGAYIQALRNGQRMTLTEVAAAAGTDASQLSRIEDGEIDTRGTLLVGLIRAVNGNPDDLFKLTERKDMPPSEGTRLANEWLTKPKLDRTAEELLNDYGPEIIEILDDLTQKPRLMDKWLGYGRGLKESDSTS